MRNGETIHLPSDKRGLSRKPFHAIEVKHRLIPVIHGRIGSENHKKFNESDLGRALTNLGGRI